jgi:opacity protein-like surface antigen
MMRSFLSSSFIRLAITAGSTRSKPLNTTAKGTKNHNQNTRNGPRSGESGQIHPPRNTLTDRRAFTCGRARLLGAHARLGEHEIPRALVYGGRGRGGGGGDERKRLASFVAANSCVASLCCC